ncbi:MAG: hypothetical protein ACTHMT_15400 [Verrucomicrobiota bacterium]|jgi:hypothetical protein
MNKKTIFLLLAIVFFGIGIATMFTDGIVGHIAQGLCKGLGLVFFILFLVQVLLGKQPLDKMPH